jgi:hypothetical protein
MTPVGTGTAPPWRSTVMLVPDWIGVVEGCLMTVAIWISNSEYTPVSSSDRKASALVTTPRTTASLWDRGSAGRLPIVLTCTAMSSTGTPSMPCDRSGRCRPSLNWRDRFCRALSDGVSLMDMHVLTKLTAGLLDHAVLLEAEGAAYGVEPRVVRAVPSEEHRAGWLDERVEVELDVVRRRRPPRPLAGCSDGLRLPGGRCGSWGAIARRPTPWFWGINGAAGVVASSLRWP